MTVLRLKLIVGFPEGRVFLDQVKVMRVRWEAASFAFLFSERAVRRIDLVTLILGRFSNFPVVVVVSGDGQAARFAGS